MDTLNLFPFKGHLSFLEIKDKVIILGGKWAFYEENAL